MTWRPLLFVLLTVGLLIALAPTPRVEIRRAPAFVTSGAEVVMLISVPPRAENRALILAAIYAGCQGTVGTCSGARSTRQLEGLDAPQFHEIVWRRVPPGEYVLTAIVLDSRRELGRTTRPMTVLGR